MSWKKAQEAELKSWLINDEAKRREKIERETARYPKLRKEMGFDLIDLTDKRILEIGGGPVGVVADVLCKEKTILDPLAFEYAKHFPCPYHKKGVGEALPFANGELDMVVICNALDHCQSPEIVLFEVRRVLRPGGWLALHNCLNLASIHKHPGHLINLDESWFYHQLKNDFEIVNFKKTRYGWVKYRGSVGQPALAILARKVTGYGVR